MIQIKKTILTLVALLAVTTGAWAEGYYDININFNPVYNPEFTFFMCDVMGPDMPSGTLGLWIDNSYTGSFRVDNGMCSTEIHSLDAGDHTWYAEFTPDGSSEKSTEQRSFTIDQAFAYVYIDDPEQSSIEMGVGESRNFRGHVDGPESSEVNISSSNDNVAKFRASSSYPYGFEGYIDAVGAGTATITVSFAGNKNYKAAQSKTLTVTVLAPAASGPEVAWNKAEKTGTFTMPGGNVTLEPEYYPQAALTAAPTAINDVPATTDGAIVKAGTVANIPSSETAQGTVMYYVSPTALDDAALLALAADQWTADVPTAEKLTKGEAYVYYYVRGNDSDTDEENFSDGDILAANALTVTIAAEPTKVTLAANDKTMGTVEVAGESKVEWTADTWKGWTADIKKYTVDDITMTSSESAHIREYTSEDQYNNSLFFFVRYMIDDATVTFSTTGDPFSRIEFTMIGDYSERNPNIIPNDNWTFEGKSAVWEGEATKSLTLQSCSTNVSKITFYKGAAIPDGVTVNGDGTFTVAKTATVKLKATPAEGYKFLYWEDDQTNTNPVREVTIESGMADMTYKAVFAEILYNVTFAEGTDPNEWSASPAAGVKKGQTVTVTYTGTKKVIGVKAEKKAAEPVADIVWDGTNVSDLRVQGDFLTYEKEGVTLSGNADNMEVNWVNFGDPTTDGISFIANESGGFTFTAPNGKAFTKIEMKALGSYGWAQENLGTGWAYFGDDTNKIYKVTWTGSAASTVKLLTGTDNFFGDYISSIAFYLSE